jgi:hypothetical protein
MSAGSWASSASTVSFIVSTVHAIATQYTRYGIEGRGRACRCSFLCAQPEEPIALPKLSMH